MRREKRSWWATSQTIVRRPLRAAARPSARATVVFPTPPLPVTKTSRFSNRSEIGGRLCEGIPLQREKRAPMTNSKAQVIAFANQKGGVAKTTTTLNLAAAFVERRHRVLCVDLDPQGNLTMSQGIDRLPGCVDVRRAGAPALHPRGDPQARGGRGLLVHRPRGRRDRDVHDDRP